MSPSRFFKCGCCPDLEQFCKKADEMVWQERDQAMARSGLTYEDVMPREDAEHAAWSEGYARGWMVCHISMQEELGSYEDVPDEDLEPLDDGYNEDPRAMGLGA